MSALYSIVNQFYNLTKTSTNHSLIMKALNTGDKDTWLVAIDYMLESGMIDSSPTEDTLGDLVDVIESKVLHQHFDWFLGEMKVGNKLLLSIDLGVSGENRLPIYGLRLKVISGFSYKDSTFISPSFNGPDGLYNKVRKQFGGVPSCYINQDFNIIFTDGSKISMDKLNYNNTYCWVSQ